MNAAEIILFAVCEGFVFAVPMVAAGLVFWALWVLTSDSCDD